MNFANLTAIPTWGLVAFGLALLGALVATLVAVRARRAPAWTLGLAPLAGAAAFASATAPQSMVTLSMALASMGLLLVTLVAGGVALAPVGSEGGTDGKR